MTASPCKGGILEEHENFNPGILEEHENFNPGNTRTLIQVFLQNF